MKEMFIACRKPLGADWAVNLPMARNRCGPEPAGLTSSGSDSKQVLKEHIPPRRERHSFTTRSVTSVVALAPTLLAVVLAIVGLGALPAAASTAAASPTWSLLSPARKPPPRSDASMTYDAATGQVLLFGGYNGTSRLDDTWDWTGTNWSELFPSNSPSARQQAALAYDANTKQVLLFGGYGGGSDALGDTWRWSGTDWVKLSPVTEPPARFAASMFYDAGSKQLLMFGGYTGHKVLGDTWSWTGTDWAALSPSASPSARDGASIADDPVTQQLVLFGGYDGTAVLADTWTWSGSNWTKLSPAMNPSGRQYASMAYDATTEQMVMFGGWDPNNPDSFDDTWAWNGATWSPLSPTQSPAGRFAADMCTASKGIVLFGGGGMQYFNDTWTFQGVSTPPGAPSRLRAASGDAMDTLSWNAPLFDGGSAVTGFDIYESTKAGGEGTKPVNRSLLAASARRYVAAGLKDGTRYYFTVAAINAVGISPFSNEASATPVAKPGPPSTLKAVASKERVLLTWKAPSSDGGSAVTGYYVYEGTKSGKERSKPLNIKPLSASTLTYTVADLKKSTRYFFVVRAINLAGVGRASQQVTAIPS